MPSAAFVANAHRSTTIATRLRLASLVLATHKRPYNYLECSNLARYRRDLSYIYRARVLREIAFGVGGMGIRDTNKA